MNSWNELSNDRNVRAMHLKISEKIHQFFVDLVECIQIQKGYVILEEKMIHREEQ